MTQAESFFYWEGEALVLKIVVQPKAGKDEIVGPQGDELKIRIKAPPVDGKANDGLVKFLSKTFKVPKSNIHLISGEASRHKRLSIQAPKRLPDGITLTPCAK